MTYKIITNDLWVEKGITQIFLQIEITDKDEVWTKAARLHSSDVARVVADPTQINAIALDMANKAVARKPKEKLDEEYEKTMALEKVKLETANAQLELEKTKLELEKTKLAVLQLSKS